MEDRKETRDTSTSGVEPHMEPLDPDVFPCASVGTYSDPSCSHDEFLLEDWDLEAEDSAGTAPQTSGFTPIHELSLHHLPEEIRTEENLLSIRSAAVRVVCIRNNKISSKRPDSLKLKENQRSLKGTGFILWRNLLCAVVSTNRHVLYNEEELHSSSLLVAYDKPMIINGQTNREIVTIQRGRGFQILRGNENEDFVVALYSLEGKLNHLFPTRCDIDIPVLMRQYSPEKTADPGSPSDIVCVISHPSGRPKQVSFGRVLKESLENREFRHDAPTEPGSSGAPIMIISSVSPKVPENCVWYHIATGRETGQKVARLQINDDELFEINIDGAGKADLISCDKFVRQKIEKWLCKSDLEYAYPSLLACLGGAILQGQKCHSKLEGNSLQACGQIPLFQKQYIASCDIQHKAAASSLLKQYRKNTTHLFRTVGYKELEMRRKFLPPTMSEWPGFDDNASETVDASHVGTRRKKSDKAWFFKLETLHAILDSPELCHCRSILKLVTPNSQSDYTAQEDPEEPTFYMPDARPFHLKEETRWPFHTRNHAEFVSSSLVGKKCFIRQFLNSQEFGRFHLGGIEPTDKKHPLRELCSKLLCTMMVSRVAHEVIVNFARPTTESPDGTGGTRHESTTAPLGERIDECLRLILDQIEFALQELNAETVWIGILFDNFLREHDPVLYPEEEAGKRSAGGALDLEENTRGGKLESGDEIIYERVPHLSASAVDLGGNARSVNLESGDEIIYERIPHRSAMAGEKEEKRQNSERDNQEHADRILEIKRLLTIRHQMACEDSKRLLEHVKQHHRQDHRDGAEYKGERCHCGKPSVKSLYELAKHVKSLFYLRADGGSKSTANAGKESTRTGEGKGKRRPSGPRSHSQLGSKPRENLDLRENLVDRKSHTSGKQAQESFNSGSYTPYEELGSDEEYVYLRERGRDKAPQRFGTANLGDGSKVPSQLSSDAQSSRSSEDVTSSTDEEGSSDEDEDLQNNSPDSDEEIVTKLDNNPAFFKNISHMMLAFFFHRKQIPIVTYTSDEGEGRSPEDKRMMGLYGIWTYVTIVQFIRRILFSTEVFLHNSHQFLLRLHGTLDCKCGIHAKMKRENTGRETASSDGAFPQPDIRQGTAAVPSDEDAEQPTFGSVEEADAALSKAMDEFVCEIGDRRKVAEVLEKLGPDGGHIQDSLVTNRALRKLCHRETIFRNSDTFGISSEERDRMNDEEENSDENLEFDDSDDSETSDSGSDEFRCMKQKFKELKRMLSQRKGEDLRHRLEKSLMTSFFSLLLGARKEKVKTEPDEDAEMDMMTGMLQFMAAEGKAVEEEEEEWPELFGSGRGRGATGKRTARRLFTDEEEESASDAAKSSTQHKGTRWSGERNDSGQRSFEYAFQEMDKMMWNDLLGESDEEGFETQHHGRGNPKHRRQRKDVKQSMAGKMTEKLESAILAEAGSERKMRERTKEKKQTGNKEKDRGRGFLFPGARGQDESGGEKDSRRRAGEDWKWMDDLMGESSEDEDIDALVQLLTHDPLALYGKDASDDEDDKTCGIM